MGGRGGMTTSSVSLQDLRRRIYVTAKAEFRLEEVEYRRGSMNGSGSSETTGRLLGCARKRSWSIGHITHDAKQTGERRTGNPFAPFEAAGAGDGPMRAPRQSSTLRVSRERQVRLAGASPAGARARRPVAWIAGRRETETLKPIDKAIERMVSESPGRNASERELAPKDPNPGGRAVDHSAKATRADAVWLTRRRAPAGA